MPDWTRRPAHRHLPNLQQLYTWRSDSSRGFMFDVDAQTRQVVLHTETHRRNYALATKALAAGAMVDGGVIDVGTEVFDSGAIRCTCGRQVELTNDWKGERCECGREYGSDGQEFRANWRHFCRETGEVSDEDFL